MDFLAIKPFIFSIVCGLSFVLLYYNLNKKISYLKLAQPYKIPGSFRNRLTNVLKVAFGQTKIFRENPAGLIHAMIFWGFLVLLFTASESVFQGFYRDFSWNFLGPFYTIITLSTDLLCALIIVSVIFAFIRHFVTKVPRLQVGSEEKIDVVIVLFSILIIVTALIVEKAAAIAAFPKEEWAFQPISAVLSTLFSSESSEAFYEAFWSIHIAMIFIFMNYLPFSKHFHVYTSIPNVYFASERMPNKIEKMDFEKEGVEKFGIVDFTDLPWKSLLDGYSCTHCGRCTSVCPANLTGKILNPKEIIVEIRKRVADAAPALMKEFKSKATSQKSEKIEFAFSESEQQILNKKFVGDYESIEALWQCTSCGACMQECPVSIEHVPAIVGMRQSLVMMEANFPQLLQSAFGNLENNASPWAFSQAERADWAAGTGISTAAEKLDFDILFWVGCAGSYDDRAKKISMAFSKLMQVAGVNFAILGTEEMCNGDVARRTGNEYLADMLIKANIKTLSKYNVKKIVTICPHCYNTMKNEYPDFGGNYEVISHVEFMNDLIEKGKLPLIKEFESLQSVVYHDSCYFSRYNNIIEQPRNILKAIPGLTFSETARHGDRSFCCGAGGGQMFMEETAGKRVNIERTEELIKKNPDIIALSCPFCMTMIGDGVKALDNGYVKVLVISEILVERVKA